MDIANELWIVLISASPFVELRGAIPLGIANGMGAAKVFFLAIIGNTIPIIPLLVFLKWSVNKLEKMKGIGKVLRWWFERVEKKSKMVQTYGFWGLVLFVSIPLPGSGVWSGSVAATLLEFKFGRAFLAIFLGMLIAAVLVTFASLGVIKLWFMFI
ncbi:MAG: small multi-drug export protein [Candidatus Omnitrophota bacterium]|nr:MAG: small multi-drug export protein [Candidatus Omnitrophota bacterium]